MIMYKVYWTDCDSGQIREYQTDNMVAALNMSNTMRQEGHRFVVMAVENTDMVGSFGVQAVIDGKLPNGDDYTWKKRRI